MSIDDAKTRILDAAGPIFAEKGYRGASVREICDLAGVNQAAINYHFGSKETLYCETFRIAHPLGTVDLEQVKPEGDLNDPPDVKFRHFVRFTMTMFMGRDNESWQGQLVARQIADPVPACQQQLISFIERYFQRLLAILTQLMPPDTPDHRIRKMGFSVMGQCMHYRFGRPVIQLLVEPEEWERHFQIEQLVDHIVAVSLAAIGRGKAIGGDESDADMPRIDGVEVV